MKIRFFIKKLCALFCVLLSFALFSIVSYAIDDDEISFSHYYACIEHEHISSNPSDFSINCTHYGSVGFDVIDTGDVHGHIVATITHDKPIFPPCDDVMYWELQYVIFNPFNGAIMEAPRVRSGYLAPSASCIEDFGGPLDYVLEAKLITTVHGDRSETEWIRVPFRE